MKETKGKAPLRVANVLEEGRFGGPQNRVLQVAERLKDHGVETVVIIPQRDSDYFYSRLEEKKIRVRRLPIRRLTIQTRGQLAWLVHFLPNLLRLRRCLREEGAQIVHCNEASVILGVLAARLAGARVVWHLNNTCDPWPLRLSFRLLRPLAHGFVTTGRRARRYHLGTTGLGKKPVAEIQAPVDTRRFDPARVLPEPSLSQLSGVKIGTVSSVVPGKGLEHFIEMAGLLSQRYGNLHFFIVGPHRENYSAYSRRLQQLTARHRLDNLCFFGESDRIPEVLKALDIYVCPSSMESGPMVVWEAMSMGKAIVSTDVGDVAEYIADGRNGFVVPPESAAALAEKVAALVEDEGLRTKFGAAARLVAQRDLDVSVCADKHLKFYREVANSHSPRGLPAG